MPPGVISETRSLSLSGFPIMCPLKSSLHHRGLVSTAGGNSCDADHRGGPILKMDQNSHIAQKRVMGARLAGVAGGRLDQMKVRRHGRTIGRGLHERSPKLGMRPGITAGLIAEIPVPRPPL